MTYEPVSTRRPSNAFVPSPIFLGIIVIFIGSGLEFLWRSIVAVIASAFIIPIPWVYRWMSQWLASQTVLADRGAQANA